MTIAERPGRVVVGIDDTLSGLQALRVAVAEARARDRPMHAVRTVGPAPPDPAHPSVGGTGWPSAHEPPQREALVAKGAATIDRAFGDTMGGLPVDLEVRSVVVPDAPGPVLVEYACRDEDLLVVGTGRRGLWRRLHGSPVVRHCLRRAGCPVLVVPPPPMTREGSPRALLRELRREIDQLAEGHVDR